MKYISTRDAQATPVDFTDILLGGLAPDGGLYLPQEYPSVDAATLARDDLLDIVSSDYVPAALLNAGLLLARLWDALPRGMATITATPADAVGLADRGRLAPGLRGDLIRFRVHEGAAVLRGTWVAGARVA